MIVVLTAAAVADLEEIGDRIAADNPSRAMTFIAELPVPAYGRPGMTLQ